MVIRKLSVYKFIGGYDTLEDYQSSYKEKISSMANYNYRRNSLERFLGIVDLRDHIPRLRTYSTSRMYLLDNRSMFKMVMSLDQLSGVKTVKSELAKDHNLYFLNNRRKNKMRNNYNNIGSVFNMYKNRALSAATEYAINGVKRTFGKEYLFIYGDNQLIIKEIIDKFIKKYDKNFERHVTKSNQDEPSIVNKQFIIPLRRDTFVYVATGNKIGQSEDRYLMSNSISSKDMYIYIFGKKANYIIRDFEKLTHDIYCSNDLGIFTVDANNRMSFGNEDPVSESLDVTYNDLAIRTLDTLFFSHGEKEKICNHIDKFNANKEFYESKQLLYKTGIMLFGEPGTGKSSLVKALASTYNRSIVNVNVSNLKYIDLVKLTQAINVDDVRDYIILLEDIDTLFLNREDDKSDKDDQAVINKLLQFLDSNTSPTNVIFIATTNHLERLDQALLREGRFDLKVEIKPLKDKESVEFGTSFTLSEDVSKDLIKSIHKEFPDRELINQSLLQSRILSKIENRSVEESERIHGVMEE